MKLYFTLLFLMISLISNAQTETELIGKWTYKEVYEKEKLDEKSLKMVDMMFNDFTITFLEESKYHFSGMGKEENGTWTLKKKKIKAVSDKGKEGEFEIIELTTSTLIVKMGSTQLVLVSVNEAEDSE
jgi:hypothetical protein